MKKPAAKFYFIFSAILYAMAIMKIFATNFEGGVIWLGLGSAFLCLGAAMLNQSKNKANKPEEKKSADSVLTDEEKAEIQKQNDDFTTIDTMM